MENTEMNESDDSLDDEPSFHPVNMSSLTKGLSDTAMAEQLKVKKRKKTSNSPVEDDSSSNSDSDLPSPDIDVEKLRRDAFDKSLNVSAFRRHEIVPNRPKKSENISGNAEEAKKDKSNISKRDSKLDEQGSSTSESSKDTEPKRRKTKSISSAAIAENSERSQKSSSGFLIPPPKRIPSSSPTRKSYTENSNIFHSTPINQRYKHQEDLPDITPIGVLNRPEHLTVPRRAGGLPKEDVNFNSFARPSSVASQKLRVSVANQLEGIAKKGNSRMDTPRPKDSSQTATILSVVPRPTFDEDESNSDDMSASTGNVRRESTISKSTRNSTEINKSGSSSSEESNTAGRSAEISKSSRSSAQINKSTRSSAEINKSAGRSMEKNATRTSTEINKSGRISSEINRNSSDVSKSAVQSSEIIKPAHSSSEASKSARRSSEVNKSVRSSVGISKSTHSSSEVSKSTVSYAEQSSTGTSRPWDFKRNATGAMTINPAVVKNASLRNSEVGNSIKQVESNAETLSLNVRSDELGSFVNRRESKRNSKSSASSNSNLERDATSSDSRRAEVSILLNDLVDNLEEGAKSDDEFFSEPDAANLENQSSNSNSVIDLTQSEDDNADLELQSPHSVSRPQNTTALSNLNLIENTGHGRSSGSSSQDSDVQILSEHDESSKETDSIRPVISTQKRLLSISKRNERSSIIASIPLTSSSEDDARNERQASRNSSLSSRSVELQSSDSLVVDISKEENNSYKYLSSLSAKQTRSHSGMLSAISEENSLAQNLSLQNEKTLSKPNKTKMADDETPGSRSEVRSSSKARRGPPSITTVSIPSVSESTYSYSNDHDKNSKSTTPKPADSAESFPSKRNSLNIPTSTKNTRTSPRKNPVQDKEPRYAKSLDVQAHIPNSNRNTRTSPRKNPVRDKELRSSKSLDVQAHIPNSNRNTRTSPRKNPVRDKEPRSSKSLDVQAHIPNSNRNTRTSPRKNPIRDKEPRSSKSLNVQATIPISTKNNRTSPRKNLFRDEEPRSSKSLDVQAHIPTSTRNTRTSPIKNPVRNKEPRSSKSLNVQAPIPNSTRNTKISPMKNPARDKEPRSSKSLDVQAHILTSTRITRSSPRKNPVRDQESYSSMSLNGQSHGDPTNFTTVSIPSVDESTYSYSNGQDRNSKSVTSKPAVADLKRKSAPNKRKSHDFSVPTRITRSTPIKNPVHGEEPSSSKSLDVHLLKAKNVLDENKRKLESATEREGTLSKRSKRSIGTDFLSDSYEIGHSQPTSQSSRTSSRKLKQDSIQKLKEHIARETESPDAPLSKFTVPRSRFKRRRGQVGSSVSGSSTFNPSEIYGGFLSGCSQPGSSTLNPRDNFSGKLTKSKSTNEETREIVSVDLVDVPSKSSQSSSTSKHLETPAASSQQETVDSVDESEEEDEAVEEEEENEAVELEQDEEEGAIDLEKESEEEEDSEEEEAAEVEEEESEEEEAAEVEEEESEEVEAAEGEENESEEEEEELSYEEIMRRLQEEIANSDIPDRMVRDASKLKFCSKDELKRYFLIETGHEMTEGETDFFHQKAIDFCVDFSNKLCANAQLPGGVFTYQELRKALLEEKLIQDRNSEPYMQISQFFTRQQMDEIRGHLIPDKDSEVWDTFLQWQKKE